MKNKSLFSEIIKNGCTIFTVITVLTYTFGYLISLGYSSVTSEEIRFIPTISWIYLFLVFSIALAGANMILKDKRRSLGGRLLLHFTATAALYFVVVILCGGFITSGSQTLIALVLYVALYAVFSGIYALVNSIKNKSKNKKEEYKSMFH